MAPSLWQLSITHLGETQPTQQIARSVVVEADSWLSALREARRQLGEEGGVPPGASCAMAPNGGVTIDDPGRQLRYVLTLVSGQAGRAARDAHADGQTEGGAAPSLPPPAREAQGLPPSSSPTTPRSPLPPKPFSRALQTLPYSAERAAALQRDFEAARRIQAALTPPEPLPRPSSRAVAPDATLRPSAPPPAAESPAGSSPAASKSASAREAGASGARTTAAASTTTDATSPSASGADATHEAATGARSPHVSDQGMDVTLAGPPVPAGAVAANTNTGNAASTSSVRSAATGTDDHARLPVLSSRDVEPGPSSPLTYRERAFLLPGGSTAVVEQRLFDELALIQRALADRPHGKYVNLAVFDEPFEGIPMHPPRATLEWMDWRGEPVFTLIADAAASALANTNAQPPESTQARTKHDTGEPDQRLAAAFEAMPELHTLTTPVAAFEFAVSLIERLVPTEAVSVCLYDIDTHEYRFVTLTGSGASERKASAIPASVGLFGEATQQSRPLVVVSDASRAARFDPAIDGRLGLEAREIVYLPLRRQNHPLGMLQLINRRAPEGRFQESDLAVLHYIAAQLTEFLVTRRSLSH